MYEQYERRKDQRHHCRDIQENADGIEPQSYRNEEYDIRDKLLGYDDYDIPDLLIHRADARNTSITPARNPPRR